MWKPSLPFHVFWGSPVFLTHPHHLWAWGVGEREGGRGRISVPSPPVGGPVTAASRNCHTGKRHTPETRRGVEAAGADAGALSSGGRGCRAKGMACAKSLG